MKLIDRLSCAYLIAALLFGSGWRFAHGQTDSGLFALLLALAVTIIWIQAEERVRLRRRAKAYVSIEMPEDLLPDFVRDLKPNP